MSNAWTEAAVTQAAAEYVGTMLSGASRALGSGLHAVGRFVQGNPAVVIVGVIGLLLLLRLGRRR